MPENHSVKFIQNFFRIFCNFILTSKTISVINPNQTREVLKVSFTSLKKISLTTHRKDPRKFEIVLSAQDSLIFKFLEMKQSQNIQHFGPENFNQLVNYTDKRPDTQRQGELHAKFHSFTTEKNAPIQKQTES